MFNLFRAKCPLSRPDQAWVEHRMAWLVDHLGMDRMRAAKVILPIPEFFPALYSPTPTAARELLDRVCCYMGVNPSHIDLEFYSHEHGGSVGENRAKVWLEVSHMDDPVPVIAVMAQNVGHHLLLNGEKLSGDEEDFGPLTDLLTAFLGFGVLTANAVLEESTYTSGHRHYYKWRRQGYLVAPLIGYALAIFARNRTEADPEWARFLRADARVAFNNGLRFLVATGTSGLTREGTCPAYPPGAFRPVQWSEPTDESSEDADDERQDGDSCGPADKYGAASVADGHFNYGADLARQGNHEEAVKAFTEAIRLDPEDVESYLLRSASNSHLGRFREALADADRAIRLNPRELSSYRVRARALYDLAKFEEAIEECDRILRRRFLGAWYGADFSRIYQVRGLAQAARGEDEQAVKDFSRAIQENPQVLAFYKDRARALEKVGRHDQAIRDHEEVARRDPFSTQM